MSTEPTISVTVNAPEGLPAISAMLMCYPETRAEFDAVVEACGGACAFRYHSEYSAHADLPDGVTLLLHPPANERTVQAVRPLGPSIRALKDACER